MGKARQANDSFTRYTALLAAVMLLMSMMLWGNRAHADVNTSIQSVTLDSNEGGATTTWTINFTVMGGVDPLTSGTLTLNSSGGMPPGMPGMPDMTIYFPTTAANYVINGQPASSVVNNGTSYVITPSAAIQPGMPATLVISNMTNPNPGMMPGMLSSIWMYTNYDSSYSGYLLPIFTSPPPAAPTGLSTSELTYTGVKLQWNAVSGAHGYYIYQNGVKITPTPVTTTDYTVGGLTAGTEYPFAVTTVINLLESAQSAAVNVTTLTMPTLAMSNPSGNAGAEVLVPLSLVKDAADLTQIHAIEFDMTFDEAALTLAEPDAGSDIQLHYVEAGNKYRVLIGSEANGSDPSTNLSAALGNFAFTIKAGRSHGSTTAINLSNIIVSNESGDTRSLANATATITVQDTIAPSIALTASTTDYSVNVTVSIDGDGTGSGITETKWAIGEKTLEEMRTVGLPAVTPSFIATTKGMYTVYLKDAAGNEAIKTIDIPNIVIKGDANDDGVVNLLDWQKIANYILLKETPNGRQAFASRLNTGESIDVGDWVILANMLVAH